MSDARAGDNGVSLSVCVLLALGCVFAGCSSKPDAPAAEVPTVPSDPALAALVDAVGDDALLVAWWAPEQVPTLRAALKPLLVALPDAAPRRLARFFEEDPTALVLGALTGTRLKAFDGVDPKRPVVFAFGASPASQAVGDVSRSMMGEHAPVMRHRLLLPTTDIERTKASVAKALTSAKATRDNGVWHLRGLQIGLYPGPDHLRVEVARHGAPLETAPTPNPRDTPARRALLAKDAVAGVWLRGWRLSDFGGAYGAGQAFDALAEVPPEYIERMRAAALSILLNSETLITTEGVEVDDYALVVRAREGVIDVEGVASLTPDGVKTMAASHGPARRPLKKPAAVELSIGADLRAMLDAAREPPTLARSKQPAELARAVAECGITCNAHFGLRVPFGTAKLLERLAGPEIQMPAVRGIQVAMLTVASDHPELAFVAEAPAATTEERLRTLAAKAGAEFFVEPRGDKRYVLIGVGTDPRTVFDLDATPAESPLLHLRLDAARLPPEFHVPKAARGLELRVDVAGRAVVTRLRVDLGGAKPLGEATRYGGKWDSPVRARPASPGDACLRDYANEVAAVFDALSSAAPSTSSKLLAAGLMESEKKRECAGAHDATREPSLHLRHAILTFLADGESERWVPDLAALEWGCKEGDAEVCTRLKTLRARPPVRVPTAQPVCETHPPPRGPRLLVSAGAATLDGRPLAKTTAQANSIPVLAAGPEVPYGQIASALKKVRGDGVERVSLLLRTTTGLGTVQIRTVDVPPKRMFATARLTANGGAQVALEDSLPRKSDDAGVALLKTEHPDFDLVISADPDVPWQRVATSVAASCSSQMMIR